jgi:hypothetical protein
LFFLLKILSDINCSEINTLKLSSKYNDEQIDQILDGNQFSLSMFKQLRSLTLDSIGLFTFHSIIRQVFNLHHLESLIIRFRSGLCQEKLAIMYRFILYEFSFHFKSLKLLDLSISDVNKPIIDTSLQHSIKSMETIASLKYLSIGNIRNDDIENLLSYFPNLYKLNATVKLNRSNSYPLLSNLTYCILRIDSIQFESFACLLKQCPNLKQLIIYTGSVGDEVLDSYQLENLIENYLLKLKQFQMNMLITYTSLNTVQVFINDFLQNQFWVERKTKINMINEQTIVDEGFEAEIIIEFAI